MFNSPKAANIISNAINKLSPTRVLDRKIQDTQALLSQERQRHVLYKLMSHTITIN